MNPARFSARNHAYLDVESCGLACEMRGDGLLPFRTTLGMKRKPGQELGPALERGCRRESIQFEHPRRSVELIGSDVPIPVTLAGRLHRQCVALLREADRVF